MAMATTAELDYGVRAIVLGLEPMTHALFDVIALIVQLLYSQGSCTAVQL